MFIRLALNLETVPVLLPKVKGATGLLTYMIVLMCLKKRNQTKTKNQPNKEQNLQHKFKHFMSLQLSPWS